MTEKKKYNNKVIPGIAGKVLNIADNGKVTLQMLSGETVETQFKQVTGVGKGRKYEDMTGQDVKVAQAKSSLEYFGGAMVQAQAKATYAKIIESTDAQISQEDLVMDTSDFLKVLAEDNMSDEEVKELVALRTDTINKISSEAMPMTRTISFSLIGCVVEIPMATMDDGKTWSSVVDFSRSVVKNNGSGAFLPTQLTSFEDDQSGETRNKQFLNTNIASSNEINAFFRHLLKSIVPHEAVKQGRKVIDPENTMKQCHGKLSFIPYIKVKEGTSFDGLNIYGNSLKEIYASKDEARVSKYEDIVTTMEGLSSYVEENPESSKDLSITINSFDKAVITNEDHNRSRAGLFSQQVENMNGKTPLNDEQNAILESNKTFYGYYILPTKGTGFFNGGMNLFNYSPKNHTIGLKVSMEVLNAG